MSSYVIVEFDTTAPEIEMYAPRYTTRDILNIITIEANETLGLYQDIYAIDSDGTRYDLTFHREKDNTYVGVIKFESMPLGIISIYARLKDEVDNFSNVITTSIEVKESLNFASVDITDHQKGIINVDDIQIATVDLTEQSKVVTLSEQERKVTTTDKTTKINISDGVRE